MRMLAHMKLMVAVDTEVRSFGALYILDSGQNIVFDYDVNLKN